MTRRRIAQALAAAIAAVVMTALTTTAAAHDFRPAFLAVEQVGPAEFTGVFSVPSTLPRADASLTWPATCDETESRVLVSSTTHRRVFSVACADDDAVTVGIPMLDTDLVVRIQRLDGSVSTDIRPNAGGSVHLSDPAATSSSFALYLWLGVEHILIGWDHLLFVLLLVLATGRDPERRVLRIAGAVTGFTLGHSVTLALAALEMVTLPGPPVEATIALSIVYLAREVLDDGAARIAHRRTWVVTSLFGLVHGFGFAGVLTEIGLPQQGMAVALLAFNLGVEVGQLAFVAVILGFGWVLARAGGLRRATVIAAYLSGAMAAFWTIERVVGFW